MTLSEVYWDVLFHLGGVRVFWPPLQTLVSLVLVLEEPRFHDCGSYAAYLRTALDSYRFRKKMLEEFWRYVKPIRTRVRSLGHQFVIVAIAQCSGGASAATAWPVVLRMPFVDHNDPQPRIGRRSAGGSAFPCLCGTWTFGLRQAPIPDLNSTQSGRVIPLWS